VLVNFVLLMEVEIGARVQYATNVQRYARVVPAGSLAKMELGLIGSDLSKL
jgi:hypothetical protein